MNPQEHIPGTEELRNAAELSAKRFATFGKEFFYGFVKKDPGYLNYIKESALLNHFNMPGELGELLIPIDSVPYYWLCDTPLLLGLEEQIGFESRRRSDRRDDYLIIKEYYSKWVIMKSPEEKKKNAVSAFHCIEKDTNPVNVAKHFMLATLLLFEKSLENPARAVELLEALRSPAAFRLPDALASSAVYFALIFKAIAFIKTGDFTQALQSCEEALEIRPGGLNAKFYEAIASTCLNENERALEALTAVLNTDIRRLEYASEKSRFQIYTFVLQNASTYSIFTGSEFAGLLKHLQPLLEGEIDESGFSFQTFAEKIERLSAMGYEEYYNPEIKNSIDYLANICKHFSETKNYFIFVSFPSLRKKFNSILDAIISQISEKQFGQIGSRMSGFELELSELRDKISICEQEQGNLKVKMKEKLDEDLARIQKSAGDAIAAIELQIEGMPLRDEFNSQKVFSNSMIYNYIISSMIFVIGGFSGCYKGTVGSSDNFNVAIASATFSGLKWSAVTFLIGLLISTVMSAFAIIDRNNQKQALIKRISLIKNRKERDTENLKKGSEAREKELILSYNTKIKILKDHLVEIAVEKQTREDLLRSEAQKFVDEHATHLLELTVS